MRLKFSFPSAFFQSLQRVIFCHFFFANFFAFIPKINCSSQCNIGLKLFSVESGNAICAPIAPHQCIESCEWVEADRGGCPLSTHYTAFRGRRTILTGMVLTESSFLIQCCASLATSVLLDADHEPICRWSEQIETVIDKPTVRLDNPLGEQEYYRDLRGTRIGRGAAKIQTEICRFIVQRTNCDRKRMTQEDLHQYSLLLLRLQRTRDFFRHSRGGVINTGFSEALNDGERARAEHRTIYKNSTSKLTDELEFLHKGRDDPDANILKAAAAALEDSPQQSKNISPSLVENEIVQEKKREKEKAESEDGKEPPRMLVDGMSNNNENDKEGKSTPKSPAERVIYNDRKRWIHHEGRQKSQQHSSRKSSFSAQIVEPTIPPSRPILADESREEGKNTSSNNSSYKNAAAARGVRELLYRAAKQGSALLLEKLNQQQRQWQKEGGGKKTSNFNASIGPRLANPPNHHQKYQKMLLPVIRHLRTFPHRHRPSRHQKEGDGPVRMEMSRLGWPKGLRRRLWPVLATNTTRELIPTRTDLNWVDNEFFDGVFPGKIRNGVTGTVRVVDPANPLGSGSNSQSSSSMWERRIRLDRLRPPEQPSAENAAGRDLRIKKLHKNLISNGRSDEVPPPIGGENNELLEDPIESSREEGPKEKLISLDGNGLDGGFLALPSGGGGSFEPEIPPRQQQILPFHAIKEINTSPLGRAPPFRVVPFGHSHQKLVPGRREGQVPSKGGNGQLAKLVECCQQQAPGCRALCTRDVSKEQIKLAMSTGQCPPLSLTSVIQCFPRFYNISSVGQCCARMSQTNSAAPNLFGQQAKKLPAQCLNLCAPDFRLSFAHLACVDHTEPIMTCYRQLLERVEGGINENGAAILEDLVADGKQQNLRQRRKKE